MNPRHNIAGSGLQVTRPSFVKGFLQQKGSTNQVLSAWDEQLIAKQMPGQHNVPYVAGMNVTNLPTNCFSVSNSLAEANRYTQPDNEPLGTSKYTIIMFSSSMTAFSGDGQPGNHSQTDKLGGMVVKMVDPGQLEDNWITRGTFEAS